ncbi:MAG: hypothetical protein FJW39_20465 [Acidobacteria bacterium]|nr:hypothetical protein [Acidobacteriota bacterium]
MPLTRRSLLTCAGTAVWAQTRRPGPERLRYLDSGTEQEVTRLTDPKLSSCWLPLPHHVVFSRRLNALLYLSDRSGSRQLWTMDLKSFNSRPWPQAAAIDPGAFTFTADERSVVYSGSGVLWFQASAGPARKLYTFENAPGRGIAVTPEGYALAGDGLRLRQVLLARATAGTIIEAKDPVSDPMPRPRRASVLYRAGDALWLAHLDGQRNFKLKTAEGIIGQALWAPDGRTVFYLHAAAAGKPNTLREADPDTGEDQPVAATSNYASFCSNRDASVIAGASGSKAGPYMLLMLRKPKRERALCEHRALDPTAVGPVFSPDSQRLVFTSELHGKPAIYMIDLQRLVEKTDEVSS